jgi:cell division septation protein DedD
MVRKFGLILLVLLFGALMFLVGVVASNSIRRPVSGLLEHPRISRTDASVPQPTHQTGTVPGAATPAEPPPVPYQALLIPSPPPPDGTYALQLGSYPTRTSAAEWVKRAQDGGWVASQISVLDQNGERWIAVAVGEFNSPDDARAARVTLSRTLALAQALPVIRLPPKSAGADASAAKQGSTPASP